jgi:hypothetical protein
MLQQQQGIRPNTSSNIGGDRIRGDTPRMRKGIVARKGSGGEVDRKLAAPDHLHDLVQAGGGRSLGGEVTKLKTVLIHCQDSHSVRGVLSKL